MSEKRFTVDGLDIQDNSPKGRLYLLDEQGGVNALCNLINGLNEKYEKQRATINELKERNAHNFAKKMQLQKEIKELKEENEQLRQKLDFYLLDEFEWKEKYGD